MHDCPCCWAECVYTDNEEDMCSCCRAAGCEGDNPGDCQIPRCEKCDNPATFATDLRWHANCDYDCPGNPSGSFPDVSWEDPEAVKRNPFGPRREP